MYKGKVPINRENGLKIKSFQKDGPTINVK